MLLIFGRLFWCCVFLDVLTLQKTSGRWSSFENWCRLELIMSQCIGGDTAKTVGPLIKHCTPPSTLLLVVGSMVALLTILPWIWFKNLISNSFGSNATLIKWDATSFQDCILDSTNSGTPNLLTEPFHWWITNASGQTTLNSSITPKHHLPFCFFWKETMFPLQCWGKLHNWVHSIYVTGPATSRTSQWDTSTWSNSTPSEITKKDLLLFDGVLSIVSGFFEWKSYKIPMELWQSLVKSMPTWPWQFFLSGKNFSSKSLCTHSRSVWAFMSDSKFETGDIISMPSEDWTRLKWSSWIKSFALSERSTMLGKDRTRHFLSFFASDMLLFSRRSDRYPCIEWCGLHWISWKRHKRHFASPTIFIHLICRRRHSMHATV